MNDFDPARPELSIPPTNTRPTWATRILRWRTSFIILTISAALLWVIAISPLLLRQVGHAKGVNWSVIGNVGQAYGGASAILAGIALVGIAGSLIIQLQQSKAERVRLVRERHHELLRIVLDNPSVYAPVMGTRTPDTVDEVRKFLFATMYINYSLMGYEMGVVSQESLAKEILPSAFASASFRTWWEISRPYWSPESSSNRRERQFRRLLHDQYDAAVQSGSPPVYRTIEEPVQPSSIDNPRVAARTISAFTAGGIVIGYALRSLTGRRLVRHR